MKAPEKREKITRMTFKNKKYKSKTLRGNIEQYMGLGGGGGREEQKQNISTWGGGGLMMRGIGGKNAKTTDLPSSETAYLHRRVKMRDLAGQQAALTKL